MFSLNAIIEYIIIAMASALLYGVCVFKPLGALQQAGYSGKRFAAWTRRKGNMIYSRYILLAFLTALSMLVLGICFSFAGKWTAYIALIPVPLFVYVFTLADRHALKVPLVSTRRVVRIYVLNLVLLAIVSFALVVGGSAAAYYSEIAIIGHLRFLLLAVLPILLPLLLIAANCLEKPISTSSNRKYLEKAREKLANAPCVKIAITGSCGKTSVKNFLATILSARYRVLATPQSFNTPLGIARTVEREDLSKYDFLIAEMGARYSGDIRELCELVRPDHCILTGICPQHMETFGSLSKIIAEKGEILKGTKKGGFAVIGQDENTDTLDAEGEGLIKVSVGEHGEFGALDIKSGADGITFKLALGILQVEAHSKLLGAHNAQNIALAAAMAYKLGLTKEEILQGIERIDYIPHRLQPIQANGLTILDDAYNANIRGAAAAVEVLKKFGGKKFVVTPGIVELGILEEEENEELGKNLVGLDCVILIGATLVCAVKRGYLSAGGDAEKLHIVPSLEKAKEVLLDAKEGDVVLFLNDLPDIYN